MNLPQMPKGVEHTEDELITLAKANRRLRMERDILKKATAFFANDPS